MSIPGYGRLYPYVVPGYTGHIPATEEETGGEFRTGLESQIPGYVGYIPHLKPENMIGKTYGKLTALAYKGDTPIGTFIDPKFRYTSNVKEAFTNQLEIQKTQGDLTNYPHSMQLTKKFNDTAKSLGQTINPDQIAEHKKTQIAWNVQDIKTKAYN